MNLYNENNNAQKTIILLGTGAPQADLIKACKERGLKVFGCSYRSGDMAEHLLDHFEQINIIDVEKVTEYARRVGADMIYSAGSDVAMPTIAAVSEQIGLPCFIDSRTASICHDKVAARAAIGFDEPFNLKFIELYELPEKLDFDYPCIMKPSDSQGQRGVHLINSFDELRKYFEHSISYSHKGSVIVEEYADGPEISVNAFSIDGKVRFALMSERFAWNNYPGGLIHFHKLPAAYQENEVFSEQLSYLISRVCEIFRINNGPSYFQIKVTQNMTVPKLIEVAPRLDGCHMWNLIKHSTGVDLLDATVSLLCGEKTVFPDHYEVKTYSTEFLCSPPDVPFDRSKYDIKDAEYLKWYYESGDNVKRMNGFMEKGGYIIYPGGPRL